MDIFIKDEHIQAFWGEFWYLEAIFWNTVTDFSFLPIFI